MWIITICFEYFCLELRMESASLKSHGMLGVVKEQNHRQKGEDAGWIPWFLPPLLVPFFLLRSIYQIQIPEFSPYLSIILSSVHIVNTIIVIMSLFFQFMWKSTSFTSSSGHFFSISLVISPSPQRLVILQGLDRRFSMLIVHSHSPDFDHTRIYLSLFNLWFSHLKFHKGRIRSI